MNRMVGCLVSLAVLLGFSWAGGRWSQRSGQGDGVGLVDALGRPFEAAPPGLMATGAGVGLLLLGAWFVGRLVARVRLPRIVGYLGFGVLCGPSLLGIVTESEMGYLVLVNDLAIALIALTAGGEIKLRFLRRWGRAVAAITFFEMLIVLVGVAGVSMLVLPRMEAFEGAGLVEILMVSLVVGTVLITNSPAVLLAMMAELHAHGRMMQIALAVTVCKDLALVVLFTVVLAIASTSIGGGGAVEGAGAISPWLSVAMHLGGSILAGVVVGLAMAWYLHRVDAHLPIFLVFACFGIALVSETLHLETLLVAVVAGMLMRNAWGERLEGFFETVEEMSTPVYCVFFAVAGAKLSLGSVVEMWHLAMVLVAVRLVMVWAGTAVGARAGGVEGETRRWLWTALTPQAGVSLALALIVDETFGGLGFGGSLFSLLLAVIAINQVVGPLLLSFGIRRAGGEATEEPSG